MVVNLGLRKLKTDNPLLEKISATYERVFPRQQRRDFALLRVLLAKNPQFSLYALLRNGMYIGFLSAWDLDALVFVEHFALNEAARGQGAGSACLRGFLETARGRPAALEVEPPLDEISRRRIRFYERQGFVLDEQVYFQPPYRAEDAPAQMRLMFHGAEPKLFHEDARRHIHTQVYGVRDDEFSASPSLSTSASTPSTSNDGR